MPEPGGWQELGQLLRVSTKQVTGLSEIHLHQKPGTHVPKAHFLGPRDGDQVPGSRSQPTHFFFFFFWQHYCFHLEIDVMLLHIFFLLKYS